MKTQRVSIGLIILNLLLLGFQFAHGSQPRTEPAAVPVIRTHALELVDDQGRVRAELRVTPPQPEMKMPDGTKGYPEAVLFRLITSRNEPHVKLVATEDGAGLVVGGERGHVQVLSRNAESFIKVKGADGTEKTLKP